MVALTPHLQAAQLPKLKKLIQDAKTGGAGLTWDSPLLADVSVAGRRALEAAGLEPGTALLLVDKVGYMEPGDLKVRDGDGEPWPSTCIQIRPTPCPHCSHPSRSPDIKPLCFPPVHRIHLYLSIVHHLPQLLA